MSQLWISDSPIWKRNGKKKGKKEGLKKRNKYIQKETKKFKVRHLKVCPQSLYYVTLGHWICSVHSKGPTKQTSGFEITVIRIAHDSYGTCLALVFIWNKINLWIDYRFVKITDPNYTFDIAQARCSLREIEGIWYMAQRKLCNLSHLRVFRIPLRCQLDLRPSGMLRSVYW